MLLSALLARLFCLGLSVRYISSNFVGVIGFTANAVLFCLFGWDFLGGKETI